MAQLLGLAFLLVICLWLLIDARNRTRQIAEQSELNVVEALSSTIHHDLDSLSLSINGTINALDIPGLWETTPALRQSTLFDSSVQVKSLSSILLIDGDGQLRAMSGTMKAPAADFGTREYFQYHKTHLDMGFHIIGPTISRLNGSPMLILSRRVNDSKGHFAGVAAGGLFVSYYYDLFRHFDLGAGGSLALVTTEGRLVARLPQDPRAERADLSKTSLFVHAAQAPSGTYTDISVIDGQERLIAYHAIDDFPFIVVYAHSTQNVFAEWLRLSAYIGAALLVLSCLMIVLIWTLRQERQRRIAAEQKARVSASTLASVNQGLEKRIEGEILLREDALERLAASQRLEALGQLAGGIAHDINNVLQAITGACSVLQARSKANDDAQRLTTVAISAADRGSAITQRLLVFARRAVIKAEPVDLAALLDDLRELLSHTLCGSVVVNLEIGNDLPKVLVDRMQLETVIINLATNARDAMSNGGTITITAEAVTTDSSNRRQSTDPVTGQFVRIAVTDTGIGMEKHVLARAVEPFFSTKGVGKGTGLGLSMAKGFAEQSNGKFEISSRPGTGTTVALWFPVGEMPSPTDRLQAPTDAPVRMSAPKSARILVVDDDQMARELTGEWLTSAGFKVHQAQSGKEALLALTTGTEIDLLLTDLSMPEIDGIQLIQLVRKSIPNLPALILTGNTGAVASLAIEDVVDGKCMVLQKPIKMNELSDHIELALSSSFIS